jgi:hypothetical protein
VYLPHVKKYTLNSLIKNDLDKIRAVKHVFDSVKTDFKRQNKKAQALEKPLRCVDGKKIVTEKMTEKNTRTKKKHGEKRKKYLTEFFVVFISEVTSRLPTPKKSPFMNTAKKSRKLKLNWNVSKF